MTDTPETAPRVLHQTLVGAGTMLLGVFYAWGATGIPGEAGYAGGYIDHYLWPLLYPAGLTREGQWALGAGVLILNGAVYGALLARRHRARPADRSGRR